MDTDQFSDLIILALTALGESESLGEDGMQQTINSVMNRVAADLAWMGGNNARAVCLQKGQYDCWNQGSSDRERIINIATNNPLYTPYVTAIGLASSALAGTLPDVTGGAVSYFDSGACKPPYWARDKEPCAIIGQRWFYPLSAVE